MRATSLALTVIVSFFGCGGSYQTGDRQPGQTDRGETNGRSFEFISNLPDGEDWQLRVRESSLWVSYSEGEDTTTYKPVNLDKRETKKVWDLIDALALEDRKKGKRDEDDGYVMLRDRWPDGENTEVITVFVSRLTEDEDVLALGGYLQTLIKKYHQREADF